MMTNEDHPDQERLVIDASVVRQIDNINVKLRVLDFLEAVLNLHYEVVTSNEVQAEWLSIDSQFMDWYLTMISQRRFQFLNNTRRPDLRAGIKAHAATPGEAITMLEDIHLLEAALASDLRVISRDEEVRALFQQVCLHIAELANIVWVNPGKSTESAKAWLENGAPRELHRTLGYHPDL
jgi:hypothetical protein